MPKFVLSKIVAENQYTIKIWIMSEMNLKIFFSVEIFVFLPFKTAYCKMEFMSNSLTVKMRLSAGWYFFRANYA